MKNLFFVFLSVTILIQCSKDGPVDKNSISSCVIDKEFRSEYIKCLQVLIDVREGKSISFIARMKAVECLETITDIESHVIKRSDTPYLLYEINPEDSTKDMFETDIRSWLFWLTENICNYSNTDALRAFELTGTELGWPPEDL